ncbi:ribosomal protein L7Ae [Histomonas meleagridis]|uniref:ribosomal protein L7Ae n=1 Tax=Histomonas meleagridis TaxID=135588 RepID=UPI00355964E1|nr:ribosomal protein L7Ae [Histomonas meleagridis]KAH0800670.1 ribosomal protein L7Ae [Histomonas meleagridis]
MSRRTARAQPEKVILDADIKNQDFLFTQEKKQAKVVASSKVRFPKYVRIQRQRRILMKRLKVPPPVNHFNHAVDKATAVQIFKFLEKYRPETKAEKKLRLKAAAEKSEKSLAPADVSAKKALAYGIKDVTSLVEAKKASLVVIAHDVDPIEIVIWLPALCRKLDIPYVIVKSKARLGKVVGMKTCTCIAVSDVRPEDRKALSQIVDSVNANFLMKYKEEMHHWGGGELSEKTIAKLRAQGKHE